MFIFKKSTAKLDLKGCLSVHLNQVNGTIQSQRSRLYNYSNVDKTNVNKYRNLSATTLAVTQTISIGINCSTVTD